MKKSRCILVTAFTSILLLHIFYFDTTLNRHSVAAQSASEKQISVVGTGTVTVDPDVVYVQFGVETSGKTASEALQKNAKIFESVKTALKKAGVAEKDIQTAQFNAYPQYNYDDKKGQELIGYRVQNIVRVTYRDLKNVGTFLDQLTAAGINRVDSISFGSEKMDEYEKKALNLAVQDAKAEAEVLAQAAGVKIKGVVSITQAGAAQPPIMYRQKVATESTPSGQTEIYAGQLKVETTVNVIYTFQ